MNNIINHVYIYSLSNPISNEIKYVGKAKNIEKRLREHLYEKANNKKNNWIKSLKKMNLIPKIEIIDIVDECEWQFWEKYWISQFKTWGFELKNSNEGGCGANNPSSETRFKNGSGKRGKTYEQVFGIEKSELLKANISLKNKERVIKQDTKDKISKNNSKYWKTHNYPIKSLKNAHNASKKNSNSI
jgi:predicted GIY-YIG superfamily endonuclease